MSAWDSRISILYVFYVQQRLISWIKNVADTCIQTALINVSCVILIHTLCRQTIKKNKYYKYNFAFFPIVPSKKRHYDLLNQRMIGYIVEYFHFKLYPPFSIKSTAPIWKNLPTPPCTVCFVLDCYRKGRSICHFCSTIECNISILSFTQVLSIGKTSTSRQLRGFHPL